MCWGLAFLKNVSDDFEKNKKKFIRLQFQTNDIVSLVLVYQSSSTIQQRYKINFFASSQNMQNKTRAKYDGLRDNFRCQAGKGEAEGIEAPNLEVLFLSGILAPQKRKAAYWQQA